MPRYAAKRDSNEAEIVAALRQVGATVGFINGADMPDLIVGFRGKNFLLEVKSGPYRKLTDGQAEWHEDWAGQVAVVKSIEEALDVIQVGG